MRFNKLLFLFGVFLLLVFIFGCSSSEEALVLDSSLEVEEVASLDSEVKTLSDGTKYIIHPDKIRGGGPPKDGIPSIDNPRFVSVDEADEWIEDNELVLAIDYKGVKRVYPLQIMVWHEIVNDEIAGEKVLITYCPLCGSGIAYIPEIEVGGVKEKVNFGTSGKLFNSNLIMYDRRTDTYWQQIDGKAIVGELVGQELEEISIDTVVWRDYKAVFEDAEVLSQQTGYSRSYGKDPYGNYYEDSFLIFPVENEDDRVHPKTIIFGVEVDGNFKAYREDDLKKLGSVIDLVGNVSLRVSRDDVGIVKIVRVDSGLEVVKERDMWFAWYAFHPETLLYEME
jgi:hypothetical protein